MGGQARGVHHTYLRSPLGAAFFFFLFFSRALERFVCPQYLGSYLYADRGCIEGAEEKPGPPVAGGSQPADVPFTIRFDKFSQRVATLSALHPPSFTIAYTSVPPYFTSSGSPNPADLCWFHRLFKKWINCLLYMEAGNLGGVSKLWPATASPLPSAPLWHCLPPFSRFGTLYIAFYKYVTLLPHRHYHQP